MKLSQTDLKILEQIAKGNNDIKIISKNIDRSDKQVYKSSNKLKNNNFLELKNGKLEPKKFTHLTILLQLLSKYPNLTAILSGSGIQVLCSLLKPKNVKQTAQETNLRKTAVYDKIKQAMEVSAVIQVENKKYVINEKIWRDIKNFLEEFKKYEETTDPRAPANSTIYYKNDEEIVFSNKGKLDAISTGFSAYRQFGIKLLLPMNYYYLPKKPLSKMEIFMHSLYITQKEKDIRNLTYIGLFYAKYKHELQKIHHPIVDKIKLILKGERLEGYPTLEELRDKAEAYDIRL